MQRSIAITKEGWYYLGMMGFVIAGAMIRDINLLYIMAGMMLGPLLYSGFAATRSVRSLKLRRRFPNLVGIGEPLHVEVLASKPIGARRALAVLVDDQIQSKSKAVRPQIAKLFFPEVGPGSTSENSYCVRILRRGKYNLGPLKASTAMPIGLVRAAVKNSEEQSVLVSPQIGTLQRGWTRQLNLNDEGGQKSVRRRGKAEGDFYGMREWRDGDSRNWIHWRTSAKRNKLTVRQFEQRSNQDLVVVLDLHRSKDLTDIPLEKLELAISFVATLVVQQCNQSATQLTVASASEHPFCLHGASSPAFRREVMEHLAIVEATPLDPLPDVLAQAINRSTGNARVVLVTTQDRDLSDTERFASGQTSVGNAMSQILTINVLTANFSEYFQLPDEPTSVDVTNPEGALKQESLVS